MAKDIKDMIDKYKKHGIIIKRSPYGSPEEYAKALKKGRENPNNTWANALISLGIGCVIGLIAMAIFGGGLVVFAVVGLVGALVALVATGCVVLW